MVMRCEIDVWGGIVQMDSERECFVLLIRVIIRITMWDIEVMHETFL